MVISKIVQQLINIAVRRGKHTEIKHLSTKGRLVTKKQYMLQHNPEKDMLVHNVLSECYDIASTGCLTAEIDLSDDTFGKMVKIFGEEQVVKLNSRYLISW